MNMESVEALWAAHFGNVDTVGLPNGGVLVFESRRVFGGDSGYYYLGGYQISGRTMFAHIEVTHFSGTNPTAFGRYINGPLHIKFEGSRESHDLIVGQIWALDLPDERLPIVLKRLASLP